MGWKETLTNISKYVTGEAMVGAAKALEETVDHSTEKVIKAASLYVIFVIGLLFFLIGLAKFLQAYNIWVDGTGFAVVGGALILIGFIVKGLR
jgi:hypothetical protein